MSHEQQQDLFGLFAPASGVHHAPPAEAHHLKEKVVFERSHRARNYRLTLRRDGTAVATIPLRGSQREAERFVAQQSEWLDRARAASTPASAWRRSVDARHAGAVAR